MFDIYMTDKYISHVFETIIYFLIQFQFRNEIPNNILPKTELNDNTTYLYLPMYVK